MAQITLIKNTPLESLNVPSSLTQRDIYRAVDTEARRTAEEFIPVYLQAFQSEGVYASHAAYAFHQSLKERAVQQIENRVMVQKDSFIVGADTYTHLHPNGNLDTAQLLKMIPEARREAVEKIEIKMSAENLVAELTTLKDFFSSVTSIDLSVKEAKALNMNYMFANKSMAGGAPNHRELPIQGFVKALKAFPELGTVVMKNVTTEDALKLALKEGLPGQALEF